MSKHIYNNPLVIAEIVSEYKKGVLIKDIANELGYSRPSISKILDNAIGKENKTNDYHSKEFLWKEKEILKLYDEGTAYKAIKSLTGASIPHIYNVVRKNGRWRGSIRKYTIQEDYFTQIDTSNKAYLLGFLYADGCMGKNTVWISLTREDRYILEKFSKELKSNRPIRDIGDKSEIESNSGKIRKRKPFSIFEFSSIKMNADLIRWGVHRNKTFTVTFPTFLKEDLMWHFIRGVFDGDGCIMNGAKNRHAVTFACNKQFAEGLCDFIKSQGISATTNKHSSFNCWYACVTGRLNVIDLCEKMYHEADLKLIRKYDKFLICKNTSKTVRINGTWKYKAA